MKKIISKLLLRMSLIPTDKLLHFFYGTIIATPFVIFGTTMEAIGFMIFISIGKEILDAKFQYSLPSWSDALFTFAPTLLLLLVKFYV